ncbi:MAG: ATP synthase F1 subunit gamma [Mycoplasma sp.]|nr:ATP synthase F1 subunit gamma [Mycoplasma sp.]
MPSLKDVKTRKDTVSTIRKITKAMELVATSKVKVAKKNFDKVLEYSSRIEDVFYNIDIKIKDWSKIIKIDKNSPRAFIVITSDIGMCGAYNSNIIKLAKSTIKNDDYLFIIGTKGSKILRKIFSEKQIILSFENVGDEPNYEVVGKIVDKIFPMLINSKIRSIHILNTKFVNSITYLPEDKKIFPFSRKRREELSKNNTVSKNAEFEPNAETVIKNALPLYFGATIYSTIASSKISEMSSRRMAMENSSDNALDIISNLEKQYNKIRQSKITQEITEIIAGAQNE